jgi:hypothetical protein
MKNFICVITLAAFFSSCQAYKCKFDCPVGQGVPCTPVTDIEQMIIETPEGSPDIFLGYLPTTEQEKPCCTTRNKTSNPLQESCSTRIWIEEKSLDCGSYVEGHYIYL